MTNIKRVRRRCGVAKPTPLSTYAAVVADYVAQVQDRAAEEHGEFERLPFASAVERAALCMWKQNKRHPHQTRIPAASLREAHRRLARAPLTTCSSFDTLHEMIGDHISDIHMIGELAIYDIADRIGSHLKLRPTRVYLHRGTRDGARELGFDGRRKHIKLAELPAAFRKLSAAECEDCLCIYKDDLRRIAKQQPPSRR